MLSEESVVLDGVAESTDLLSEVISVVKHEMERLCDISVFPFVVIELDRAWVHVVIGQLPAAHP